VALERKWDPLNFPFLKLYEKYGLGMGVSDDQIKEAGQTLVQKGVSAFRMQKEIF